MSVQPNSATSSSAPKALVIGSSGNIGRAATQYLMDSGIDVVAADYNDEANKNALSSINKKQGEITFAQIDATNISSITETIKQHNPDIVISTLPPGQLSYNAAFASAHERTTYVSSNFLTESAEADLNTLTSQQTDGEHTSFDEYVTAQGVASEWGKGLDPGLDFWLFESAIEDFKDGEIYKLTSTGAGISEDPKDMYIYTWAGITNGMGHRPASIIRDGEQINIDGREKFSDENRQDIDHLTLHDGTHIETYANDDGIFKLLEHAENLGIDLDHIEVAATLTGRHQGHCETWDPLVRQLDILNNDDTYAVDATFADVLESRLAKTDTSPVKLAVDSEVFRSIPLKSGKDNPTAKDIVEDHLSKVYAREDGKRDRSVIHIEVEGRTALGEYKEKSLEINSYGSPHLDGFTSMQKTVAGTLVESARQLIQISTEAGLQSTRSANVDPDIVFENMLEKDLITLSEQNSSQQPDFHQRAEP